MDNKKELIIMLNECAAECKSCSESCKSMPDMKECARLCTVCAQKCQQLSAQTNVSDALYQECAELCKKCADECAKHNNQHCKKCADECNKCAEACHQTKKTVKIVTGSVEKENNIVPEEYEEDRSVNIRMKKQPFPQPKNIPAKRDDKAFKKNS